MSPLARALVAAALAAGCHNPASDGPDAGAPGKGDDLDSTGACEGFERPLKVGRVRTKNAEEISGVVASRSQPGLLWAHNDDATEKPELLALTRSGRHLGQFRLDGIDAVDWEDMAIGSGPQGAPDYLYVADIGDNERERDEIQVHRIAEPEVDLQADNPDRIDITDIETFEFRYPGGEAYNAESLLVDPATGDLIIISKRDSDEEPTRVFVARGPLSEYTVSELELVATSIEAPGLAGTAVAADLSSDGGSLAVGFREGVTHVWEVSPGGELWEALLDRPCSAPSADGHQESVAFSASGNGFYMIPEGDKPPVYFVKRRPVCSAYPPAELVGEIASQSAVEISGLVRSRNQQGVLWAVNDPGNGYSTVLVAIGDDGEHLTDITVPGAENIAWEDLALGPGPDPDLDYLYVADTGDNDLERDSVTVYRLPEPLAAPGASIDPDSVEALELTFSDHDAHDVEAILIDPLRKELIAISRRRDGDDKTRVYATPLPADDSEPVVLRKVLDEDDAPALDDIIVAADISADGVTVAAGVRSGDPVLWHRHPDGPVWEAMQYRGCIGTGAPGKQRSLALDERGSYWLAAEGVRPDLYRVAPH